MHWRDRKEKMRRKVNDTTRIPANMYRGDSAPVLVQVRLHNVRESFHGDLMGTSANYSVVQDQNPVIVSLTEDYAPENGDVLCFRVGEAYVVDNVQVPDFITTTAEVTVMDKSQTPAYAPPV